MTMRAAFCAHVFLNFQCNKVLYICVCHTFLQRCFVSQTGDRERQETSGRPPMLNHLALFPLTAEREQNVKMKEKEMNKFRFNMCKCWDNWVLKGSNMSVSVKSCSVFYHWSHKHSSPALLLNFLNNKVGQMTAISCFLYRLFSYWIC